MRSAFFAWYLAAAALVVGAGCSSTSSKAAPSDAGADTGLATDDLVNGCSTFVDRRDPSADRTILWDMSLAVDDSRCMQIKVGQSISFENAFGEPGDFSAHPLLAFEGDQPNPFQTFNYATGTAEFDAPGTFGYACGTHPAMKGAVLVTAQ